MWQTSDYSRPCVERSLDGNRKSGLPRHFIWQPLEGRVPNNGLSFEGGLSVERSFRTGLIVLTNGHREIEMIYNMDIIYLHLTSRLYNCSKQLILPKYMQQLLWSNKVMHLLCLNIMLFNPICIYWQAFSCIRLLMNIANVAQQASHVCQFL